ncbi:unnamed protein product [marine sediment metagenome]|uniref:Uncharacterized protein n=1 Tax=marine sediment metagenome TaxID=412755 RepID=X1FSB9_9ZZZZ
MNELTTYLLILILINQIVILFFVIRRGIRNAPISISLVPSIGGKITRDSCEKLGGSVEEGRCIIKTVEKDREIFTDIGKIIIKF